MYTQKFSHMTRPQHNSPVTMGLQRVSTQAQVHLNVTTAGQDSTAENSSDTCLTITFSSQSEPG